MQETVTLTDELLQPWLATHDETTAQELLAALVQEHAAPVIGKIIRSKIKANFYHPGHPANDDAAEDIYAEAVTQLLVELRELKTRPDEKNIQNLPGYVARLAFNACYQHLRTQQPQRHKLKNRVRYLLRQPGLAVWEAGSGDLLCCYEKWRGVAGGAARSSRWQTLLHEGRNAIAPLFPHADVTQLPPLVLVKGLFDYGGAALELDALVNLLAELWGVTDVTESLDAPETLRRLQSYDSVAERLDDRLYLQVVWQEVCALPVRQRMALLLSLRDGQGNGITTLLPPLGIASLREIAAALELSPEEFARLWVDLPLSDDCIGALLALTRQQVINLRKSARERLARRMAAR